MGTQLDREVGEAGDGFQVGRGLPHAPVQRQEQPDVVVPAPQVPGQRGRDVAQASSSLVVRPEFLGVLKRPVEILEVVRITPRPVRPLRRRGKP